jgi:hypothetical protein
VYKSTLSKPLQPLLRFEEGVHSADGETLDLTIDHDMHPQVVVITDWKTLLKLDYHSHTVELEMCAKGV